MAGLLALFNQYRMAGTLADKERFAVELVHALRPRLWSFVRSLSDREHAEDLLQEVWQSLFKSADRFRGTEEKQFLAFCYAIARNKCADHVEGHARFPKVPFDLEEMEAALEAANNTRGLSAAERASLNEALQKLVKTDPEDVHYLNDRYFLGMSFDEMGAKYGSTSAAIRMRTARAVDRLEKLMTGKVGHA